MRLRLAQALVCLVASAGAIAGITGTAAQAGAATVAPFRTADGAIDTSALSVSYHGRLLTNTQAQQLFRAKTRNGETFGLVYDAASASQGVAHAFDSEQVADAYGRSLRSAQATQAQAVPASIPSGCSNAKNISRMYDTANCGGTLFNFLATDDYNSFGTFNNKGDDIVVGYTTICNLISVRLYPAQNHGGTFATFYGPDAGVTVANYYYFNTAQINNFESGTSTCS